MRSTLYLFGRLPHATACSAGSSANSFPALQPARPCSTEHLYTSPITTQRVPRAPPSPSTTTRVHTSIGAAQVIPEMHVGRHYTWEPKASAKSRTPVNVPAQSLHFLVVLYVGTYRRENTRPLICFRPTHLGAEFQFKSCCLQ